MGINNEKSRAVFKEIKSKLKVCDNTPLEEMKKFGLNPALYNRLGVHPNRDKLYKNLDKYSFRRNVDMCLRNKYDVCLISNWFALNYGSCLVSYAVYKILEKLNYTVLMLNKPSDYWHLHPCKNTPASNFAYNHYNISQVYNSYNLHLLNDNCNAFVTGSDQLFRPELNMDYVFQEFVYNNKNKIAFGTSFGLDRYNTNEKRLLKNKYLLQRFDSVALRERVDNVCKNIFDIVTDHIIDPTLVLPREDWENLADSANLNITPPPRYLLTYILDSNHAIDEAVMHVAERLNLDVVNIANMLHCQRRKSKLKYRKEDYSLEEFLYLYKHASFVITDSYHGSCFSIKFNKPFLSIINHARSGFRYKMFEPMNLNNRFIDKAEDAINNDIIFEDVDFSYANKYTNEKSKEAFNWLDNAIKNKKEKHFSDFENYRDIEIKDMKLKMASLIKENHNLSVKIEKLKGTRVPSFFQKIFSVTNELSVNKNVKHKVVEIFGIRLKFRKKLNN